jgi:DNA-binding GntR family transcriptional regulator
MGNEGQSVDFSPARVRVTRGLLADVFAGRIVSGRRLVETDLAERFAVSRTPVRESLGELAAVGLVALKPNCGAVLREFGPVQVREIYQVRAVLEVEAARLACGQLPVARVAELTDEFLDQLSGPTGRGWAERVWDADVALHETIARHCGNLRLAEEIRRYGNFVQVIRETVGNRDRAQETAIREHLEILNAIRTNDAAAAEAAMRRHLTVAGEAAAVAMEATLKRANRNGRAAAKAG